MENSTNQIIEKTISFVKETLKDAESGHDWYHINRVWKNGILIAEGEIQNGEKVNLLVVQLAALLHDIADHKFHGGDEKIGGKVAGNFLTENGMDEVTVKAVSNIIDRISFKGSTEGNGMDTLEGKIVQDSDRLDALGAIGVARAFSYGGFRNRKMYDPEEKPNLNMDWEAYKKNEGTTINHFYEKLLLIKDRMNTQTGKKLATVRHDFMLIYLERFYGEWNVTESKDDIEKNDY